MFVFKHQSLSVFVFEAFLIFSVLSMTSAQVPNNPCPNYFEYLNQDGRYLGKITIPHVTQGVTRLEVHLSQHGSVPTPNPSRLSLYDNQQAAFYHLLHNKPISFRVDFPFTNVLPKVTFISVNGAVICADQPYPPPSTQITLTHNLEMNIKTFNVPSNAMFLNNNGLNTFEYQYFSQPNQPNQNQNNIYTPPNRNSLSTPNTPNTFPGFLPPQLTSTTTQRSMNSNEMCGRENSEFQPFIRGGEQLNRGQFPWLTAIYRKRGPDLGFICGGSLVSSRTVISAAHCFKINNLRESRIVVLLGSYNLGAVTEAGREYREVENLVIHPDYNRNALPDADIAVLQLKEPVSFTRYITPICLWNQASDVNYIVGLSAYVAGWGANENGEPVTNEPKRAKTQIVDDNKCKASLQPHQTKVPTSTLCTTSQTNEGPCTGDSGGGLMMLYKGHWMLRGIVSAGLTRNGYCEGDQYFYFCDVAKHMNWVYQYLLS